MSRVVIKIRIMLMLVLVKVAYFMLAILMLVLSVKMANFTGYGHLPRRQRRATHCC